MFMTVYNASYIDVDLYFGSYLLQSDSGHDYTSFIFLRCTHIEFTKADYRPIRFQEHYITSSAISGGLPRA